MLLQKEEFQASQTNLCAQLCKEFAEMLQQRDTPKAYHQQERRMMFALAILTIGVSRLCFKQLVSELTLVSKKAKKKDTRLHGKRFFRL